MKRIVSVEAAENGWIVCGPGGEKRVYDRSWSTMHAVAQALGIGGALAEYMRVSRDVCDEEPKS